MNMDGVRFLISAYLETSWDEQLQRNDLREHSVPDDVIESMLEKLVLPEGY